MISKVTSSIMVILLFTQCSNTTVLESAVSSCNLESSANVEKVSIQRDGNLLVLKLNGAPNAVSMKLVDFFCVMEVLDLDLTLFNNSFQVNTVETSANFTSGFVQYDDIKLTYTFYRDTLKISYTFLLNE